MRRADRTGADIIPDRRSVETGGGALRRAAQATNEWYDHTPLQPAERRATALSSSSQRLHEDDLAHVLGQEEWEVALLPAIAEATRCTDETIQSRSSPAGRAMLCT
jgi:hypothetical protein